MNRPLAIDLCCGLGGWTAGFLAEGYDAIGFDVERHQYGDKKYPAQLVMQDVLTLSGRQFRKKAVVIVASPPCQAYSYRSMPWKRAKALPPPDNSLLEACLRIAKEAELPIVLENVKGAQKWLGPVQEIYPEYFGSPTEESPGRARWHFGSYYLWGDLPALMPTTHKLKNSGGSWFGQRDGKTLERNDPRDLRRNENGEWENAEARGGDCFNDPQWPGKQGGTKQKGSGPEWFDTGIAKHSSCSDSRKAASAMIAEIPFDLANWIAKCFKP